MFRRQLGDILTNGDLDLKVIHLYDGRGEMGDSPMYGMFVFLHSSAVRVGEISFRFVDTPTVVMYDGHIGFGIDLPHRGNHYAEMACRIVRPLAIEHGLRELFLTCAPTNIGSIRTCERLNATDLGLIDLPALYREANDITEPQYLRFRWTIM